MIRKIALGIPIICGIFVAVVSFYSYFSYKPINSNDLIKVDGTIEDWTYKEISNSNMKKGNY